MERADNVGRIPAGQRKSRGREGPAAGTLPLANPEPGSDVDQHAEKSGSGQSDSGFATGTESRFARATGHTSAGAAPEPPPASRSPLTWPRNAVAQRARAPACHANRSAVPDSSASAGTNDTCASPADG